MKNYTQDRNSVGDPEARRSFRRHVGLIIRAGDCGRVIILNTPDAWTLTFPSRVARISCKILGNHMLNEDEFVSICIDARIEIMWEVLSDIMDDACSTSDYVEELKVCFNEQLRTNYPGAKRVH